MDFIAGLNVVNQLDHEKWNQEDSQNRDFVGGRHGRIAANMTQISRICTQ
jgi:hypothetical protein